MSRTGEKLMTAIGCVLLAAAIILMSPAADRPAASDSALKPHDAAAQHPAPAAPDFASRLGQHVKP